MRIGRRLTLGLVLVALLGVTSGAAAYWSVRLLSDTVTHITHETTPELIALGDIRSSTSLMRAEAVGFALGTHLNMADAKEHLAHYREASEAADRALERLDSTEKLAEAIWGYGTKEKAERDDLEKIRRQKADVARACVKLMESAERSADNQSLTRSLEAVVRSESLLDGLLQHRISSELSESTANSAEAQASTNRTLYIVALMTLVAFGVSLAGGLVMSRSIVTPILKLNLAAQKVAQGDLGQRTKFSSKDELAELGASFNAMTAALEKSHQSIEDERRLLENTIASMADCVFFLSSEGSIRLVNRAAALLVAAEPTELEGRSFQSVVAVPQGEESVVALLAGILSEGAALGFDLVLRGAQDESVPTEANAVVVSSQDGAVSGIVIVARDMRGTRKLLEASARAAAEAQSKSQELSEAYAELDDAYRSLKQMQASLLHSGKLAAVGELAAGVAHEINNPLSGVLGHAQNMIRFGEIHELGKDNRFELLFEWAADIVNDALRCKEITENLLCFSRQEQTPKSPTDIAEVVRSTVQLLVAQFRHYKVVLQVDLDEDLPCIPASASALQQVFTNLLINARQATAPGGSVEVRASRADGGLLQVSIRDSGEGIPKENVERLFEPFFTTKPPGKGCGLGLSICDSIVREHGGDIEVRSVVGGGSTFMVRLPVVNERNHANGDTAK